MNGRPLSSGVLVLLRDKIESFEQLEVLLLIRQDEAKLWTVESIHTELGMDSAMVAEALGAVGLSTDLIEAWDDESWDAKVLASHEAGISLVGLDVGTPVVRVGGVAFFGPVVTPAPTGEEAGRLWDGALLVASVPGFYELKRTRDEEPRFDVGAATLHDRAF